MRVVGIDPGKDGGVVVVDVNGKILSKHKIPLITSAKERDQYDLREILRLLETLEGPTGEDRANVEFILEKSHPMPPTMGGSISNFHRGYSGGMWEMALAARMVRHRIVAPRTWQKYHFRDMKKMDTKQAAQIVCGRLWPETSFLRTEKCRKPDIGLMDAALIAYYGCRIGDPAQCSVAD